jgi:hypothetical protein
MVHTYVRTDKKMQKEFDSFDRVFDGCLVKSRRLCSSLLANELTGPPFSPEIPSTMTNNILVVVLCCASTSQDNGTLQTTTATKHNDQETSRHSQSLRHKEEQRGGTSSFSFVLPRTSFSSTFQGTTIYYSRNSILARI